MMRFLILKLAPVLTTILLFGTALFSQAIPDLKPYSTAINWTDYKVSSQKLSIGFPKLPVVQKQANLCSETDGASYYAYANGAVYELSWYAKSKTSIPSFCTKKTKFSKDLFSKRIEDLKAQKWGYAESETTLAGMPAIMMRASSDSASVAITRWLVWQKDRWLELAITRRKDTMVDEARFSEGLKTPNSAGIDVKDGANATFGDPDPDPANQPEGKNIKEVIILSKPRAVYTDLARESNVQGTAILKVTFLKNGGVGLVSVVKALSSGLTEQAIIAARKITFLPATNEGKPVTVVKQVEYSFSIY